MNHDELQAKLIGAARRQTPDDRVPYRFEKRVMALIAARKAVNRWSYGLWRAALSCTVVAVASGILSTCLPPTADSSKDLSQELENTLLASVEQNDIAP